jgi:hypothetical protein
VRSFRLARIAAEAERVRLHAFVGRIVTRAVIGLVALLFVSGAIVFAHLAAWYWLRTGMEESFLAATGFLGGADLLVAIVLGFLAARSTPNRVELEALDVRRKAIEAIGSTLSLARIAIPLLRVMSNARRHGGK